MEPGTLAVSGGVGAGVRMGSLLDAGGGYMVFTGMGEYAFKKSLSGVADLSLGLGRAWPLRIHAGGRYRLSDLELPVSPYAQVQLSYGKLYNVLNATLTYLGLRAGVGADYFLTANLGVGGLAAIDLGRSLSDRPAFYGVVDLFLYASYTF